MRTEVMKMKIMSFNTQHCLNFIERKIDFQIMADAIKACDADIVGLNEMRDDGPSEEYAAQTAILSGLTGLNHHFFARAITLPAGPYGNGFLSRIPIVGAEVIPVPDPERKPGRSHYETRCLLKATLEGGVTVLVIHFGLNPDEQENAVATVVEHLAKEKCILMGDFNVLPDDEVLRPIRARMKDAAELIPDPAYTFPSDQPVKKIDYIFVSPDVEIVSAEIPQIVASDHRPHTAVVNL